VAKSIPWVTTESGRLAGEVRSAGGGGFTAGNVTFVSVYEAGSVYNFSSLFQIFTRFSFHLQAYGPIRSTRSGFGKLTAISSNQSLVLIVAVCFQDLFTRWTMNVPLSFNVSATRWA
jgi:hypothetical protein